jgi:spore germination protein YaaH/flagellar hook assembly protein FlgD
LSLARRSLLARHAGQAAVAFLSTTLVATGSLIAAPAVARSGPAEATTPSIAAPRIADRGFLTSAPVENQPAAVDTAGLQPSIQYEEAEAHRNDTIAFTPGRRVAEGFSPRTTDRWTVGGVDPASLPPGRLDGKAMRAQGQDHAATPGSARSTTVDEPASRPGGATTPLADAMSWMSSDSAATTGPAIQPEAAVTSVGLRREIFGFLPYWQVNSSTLRLDYSKISTIAYFGVGADAAGNLQKRGPDGSTTVGWSGWTSSKMTSIISTAHARHTRVVLTVQSFGWNTSGLTRQKALLGSAAARLNLARQIAAAVRDRGADGVNLDFEPLASGYASQFTALIRSIRAELNRIHRGYQVTFDATGSIGNYPIENATASGGADAIFIMGYDYRASASSPVGSVAPLDRTGYDIRDTVAAYAARVAPSKLILGVPYYGRAWSTATNLIHASNTSGTKFGASTTVVYSTAADYVAKYGRKYDRGEQVAWTAYQRQNCTATYGCVTSWRQIYADDATAIRAKYDLVNAYGLRGAGIWALGYDGTRTDLWSAIHSKFIADTTAPTVGVRTMPARQPNPAFRVSWTGRDDVALKSYDVQVSTDGGPWSAWLAGTTAGSATWYGTDGHGYGFRVRGRDPKGNVSAWNVTSASVATAGLKIGAFGVVRIDGLSMRSTGDPGGTKVGTLSAGDIVAIIAGPRVSGGLAWYQIQGPLTEWGAVRPVSAGVWVAASSASTTYVSAVKPPNTTRVDSFVGELGFGGARAASIGSASGAMAARSFSPNGDRSKDTLAIDWTNQGALDSLGLRVYRSDGTLVGTVPLSGQRAAGARRVNWDGRVGGARLPNGRYLATLVGTASGRTYFDPSSGFLAASLATFGVTVDTVPPTISTESVSGSLLSPNGDGLLDTVRVAMSATGATGWTFTASPLSGSTAGPPIFTRSGSGGTIATTWDGRRAGGALAPDGSYRLSLAATDSAGNRAVRSWTIRLDTTRAGLGSTARPGTFSPNGDGATDTTRLAWTSSERITGIARIVRGTRIIRSWSIANAATGATTWIGTDAAGRRVADGRYTFRVAGRDAAGNPSSRSITIVLDRTLGSLRWSPGLFFPHDGDALAASARASFGLTRSATVTMAIYQGATLVRTIWTNRAFAAGLHAWTWNGRNAAGALVPRGTYTLRVSATSALGTSVLTRAVVVDAFSVALSASTLKSGQTLTVTFTTAEALRTAPIVSFTQHGRTAVTKTAVWLGGIRYRVSFTVASGGTGLAVVRITGRDTGGGTNVTSTTVVVR